MYKPISDYGAIGNLETMALISKDGALDWCCLPTLSSPSVFAALLDSQVGGTFQITPATAYESEQVYLKDTNVLQTTFQTTEEGRLILTDFMPLEGGLSADHKHAAADEIHRLIYADGGEIPVEVVWAPRFDYARRMPTIHAVDGGVIAETGDLRLALALPAEAMIDIDTERAVCRARFRLCGGTRRVVVTRWGSTVVDSGFDASKAALDATIEAWRAWIRQGESTGQLDWAGVRRDEVIRSLLSLKLLIFAETGAIAAAPTTSLPETLGGIRNWDYRYAWIRDASLTAQALIAVGHTGEADAFLDWVERTSRTEAAGAAFLRIMYGLRGETELAEYELPHLEGYRGSRPVRVGNGAAVQRQLDIYGDLLDAAYDLTRRGVKLDPPVAEFLSQAADQACALANLPDHGIWEVRGQQRHFVYSKGMIWVALDRAIAMQAMGHLNGDVKRWAQTRSRMHALILEEGFDPEVGAFVQSFGSKELDASNLLLPIYEVLQIDDPRVQGTIDRTLERLTKNGLVYRYQNDDGLPGKEGAFGLCTFWLVDVLALSGRLDEAYAIYEGMMTRANPLGLYSEQIDPDNGLFLGNFPQAFTHIGLINSTLYLAYAEGRHLPTPALMGTPEHRAELAQMRAT